jgi:hypothetical protein
MALSKLDNAIDAAKDNNDGRNGKEFVLSQSQ